MELCQMILNLHGNVCSTHNTFIWERNLEEKPVQHIKFCINLSICEICYCCVILTLVKVQSQAETSFPC